MDFSFLKKITDFIMPLEPIEEEDEKEEREEEKKAEPAKSPAPIKPKMTETVPPSESEIGQMRVAEGGSVAFGGMKYTAYTRKEEPVMKVKPHLTVVKSGGISVKINKPAKFEEVRTIADDLLGKHAVIVNYELVDKSEQRRISDFVNGVCYVTDGRVEQISERIVLYLPEGIDAQSVMAGYSMR